MVVRGVRRSVGIAIDHSCAVHEQEAGHENRSPLACTGSASSGAVSGFFAAPRLRRRHLHRHHPPQSGFRMASRSASTRSPPRRRHRRRRPACSDVVFVVLVVVLLREFVVAEFVARERVTVLVEVVVIKFVLVEFLVEFVFIDGVVVRHSSPGIRGLRRIIDTSLRHATPERRKSAVTGGTTWPGSCLIQGCWPRMSAASTLSSPGALPLDFSWRSASRRPGRSARVVDEGHGGGDGSVACDPAIACIR